METRDTFVIFGENKPVPTKGHYLVETSREVALMLDKGKEVDPLLPLEFLATTGTFDEWQADGFHGYIFVQNADPALCPDELIDVFSPEDQALAFVTPLYHVDDERLYDYLVVEMLEPLPYEIGVDCTPA